MDERAQGNGALSNGALGNGALGNGALGRRVAASPERAAGAPLEPAPAQPQAGRTERVEELREQYLQLLLARLETGGLEPYEYTRRVHALELATTASHMAEIVGAPLSKEPALDPVDMLLLSRRTPEHVPGGKRPRYWWMALMAFFFIVLLVVGLWLVAHSRALRNSGNNGAIAPVVLSVASGQTDAPYDCPSSQAATEFATTFV